MTPWIRAPFAVTAVQAAALVVLCTAGDPAPPATRPGGTGGVRCVVRLRDAAPPLPRITPDKDVPHCGGSLEDPVLLVRDGRVANAVVWLDGESAPASASMEPAREIELRARGCLLEPRIQVARTGVRLVLANRDAVMHNPHGWSGSRTEFNVSLIDDKLAIKRTLKEAGIHRVDCDTHTWMHAYVHVFDHPWYDVTQADGAASIRDVPAGKRRFRIWHEVLGERTVEVDVRAGETREFEVEWALRDARAPAPVPAPVPAPAPGPVPAPTPPPSAPEKPGGGDRPRH